MTLHHRYVLRLVIDNCRPSSVANLGWQAPITARTSWTEKSHPAPSSGEPEVSNKRARVWEQERGTVCVFVHQAHEVESSSSSLPSSTFNSSLFSASSVSSSVQTVARHVEVVRMVGPQTQCDCVVSSCFAKLALLRWSATSTVSPCFVHAKRMAYWTSVRLKAT